MPPAASRKMVKVQTLVNLSLPRSEKTGTGETVLRSRLVNKGTILELTEAEVNNFGRLVRVLSEENQPLPKIGAITTAQIIGVSDVNKMGRPSLQGTGAMDITDKTQVYGSEQATDWAAQPSNNPGDPSFGK